ncbi:hypothetical protein ACMD2_03501 [Ananas comosus]|uniref:Uncharacterized protein n=1 Tax=Ananas comosus TaxID=4615 RepID=A0A199VHG7_ANACO|nr:hypothetical protein ACMD2_03501 [Ananas comosus]
MRVRTNPAENAVSEDAPPLPSKKLRRPLKSLVPRRTPTPVVWWWWLIAKEGIGSTGAIRSLGRLRFDSCC